MRPADTDDTKEEENILKDEEYSEEVTSKVYPLLDQFVKFDRSFSKFEAKETLIEGIGVKEKTYLKALQTFQSSRENALQIVECLQSLDPDDILDSLVVQIKPSESTKDSLRKDFEKL